MISLKECVGCFLLNFRNWLLETLEDYPMRKFTLMTCITCMYKYDIIHIYIYMYTCVRNCQLHPKIATANYHPVSIYPHPSYGRVFFLPSYWMLGGAVQRIMNASGSFFTFGGNISIINVIVTLLYNQYSLPIGSMDWYVYLHLVDFYGKCR